MEKRFMELALELAGKGKSKVHPNPMVGAVIVRDNRVIGKGFHQCYGGNHAEVNAINNATESIRGAEMYVSLEPCSHFGKTPPCAKRLVEEGISKVYIASIDPNPLVAGKGIQILEAAGIEVETGIMDEENRKLNNRFFKYIQTGKPYLVYKAAMTLDGKTASETNDSKWISNESSRACVHGMRAELNGIMVGVNTVIADDPSLTNRSGSGENPLRIIIDSKLRIPLDSKLICDGGKTLVFTTDDYDTDVYRKLGDNENVEVIVTKSKDKRVNLTKAMDILGQMGIDGILLEGGATLASSMLREKLIDEVRIFIAPKLIGGAGNNILKSIGIEKMSEAVNLKNIEYQMFETDLLVKGEIDYVHRNS